jgi:guanosine-3',5'-bis(diphosphate) 3'-pyrophosphohydrolase
VDFDVGRSPTAALTTLRYVEAISLQVRFALFGARVPTDPVRHLIRTHRRIHRNGDARLLRRSYDVAERMHEGQLRKSGEPYITHPLAVAQILAELGMDTTTIVAALLHDTVEDTDYTMAQLLADFGGEVALLVDGVTKFEKAFYGQAAEAETIRKMIIAAGVDVRVLVIKVADRLHNMQTLDSRSVASRVRIARATMDVLIPLCDRLGVQVLKSQLEDTVLAALEPEIHADLRRWVAHRPEWTAIVDDVVNQSSAVLREQKIRAQVIARPHHLYSIYKDTYAKGHPKPHELPRIAIIVAGEENDCYTTLGVIHSKWRPVAGRFKDFIASPKNNLYRSLHTTVIGPDDRAVEVLIRTEAMQRNSEYGIAAAFRFARRGPGAHSVRGRAAGLAGHDGGHLDWLHRVLEWQREAVDPVRFIESLRCDLAEGQVHVFVNGQRLLLPEKSTPVDVAYALGPEIGDRCMAATVNGQLVFLNSPLADGDVVEIHAAGVDETRDAEGNPIGPSQDWLTFVRTPHAQLQIERRLGTRSATDDPNHAPPLPLPARVKIGRAAIGLALLHRQRGLASDIPLLSLAAELGFPDVEALYAAVADHDILAEEVVQRLIDQVDGAPIDPLAAATATARVGAPAATAASPRP